MYKEICPKEIYSCVRLWRAVVDGEKSAAIRPLRKNAVSAEKLDKLKAISWILEPNRDFEEVCDHAYYDPDEIRRQVRNGDNSMAFTGDKMQRKKRRKYAERPSKGGYDK